MMRSRAHKPMVIQKVCFCMSSLSNTTKFHVKVILSPYQRTAATTSHLPYSRQSCGQLRTICSLILKKTAIVNFSLNHCKPNDDPVTFDQTTITPSEFVIFLGILVDNHLSFIDHVEHLVKKCNSKLF